MLVWNLATHQSYRVTSGQCCCELGSVKNTQSFHLYPRHPEGQMLIISYPHFRSDQTKFSQVAKTLLKFITYEQLSFGWWNRMHYQDTHYQNTFVTSLYQDTHYQNTFVTNLSCKNSLFQTVWCPTVLPMLLMYDPGFQNCRLIRTFHTYSPLIFSLYSDPPLPPFTNYNLTNQGKSQN